MRTQLLPGSMLAIAFALFAVPARHRYEPAPRTREQAADE